MFSLAFLGLQCNQKHHGFMLHFVSPTLHSCLLLGYDYIDDAHSNVPYYRSAASVQNIVDFDFVSLCRFARAV